MSRVAKPKLSPNQVELLARYFTASNVGTMWDGRGEPSKDNPRDYVESYFRLAAMNHADAGIDLECERGGELSAWRKDIKKSPAEWIKTFEERFGAGSVAKLEVRP